MKEIEKMRFVNFVIRILLEQMAMVVENLIRPNNLQIHSKNFGPKIQTLNHLLFVQEVSHYFN